MTLREGEYTGNLRRKYHIALCAEIALKVAMDLS
jgi:hypothetical protein